MSNVSSVITTTYLLKNCIKHARIITTQDTLSTSKPSQNISLLIYDDSELQITSMISQELKSKD